MPALPQSGSIACVRPCRSRAQKGSFVSANLTSLTNFTDEEPEREVTSCTLDPSNLLTRKAEHKRLACAHGSRQR